MQKPDLDYLLLGSPPIGDLAAKLLQESDYPPKAFISDTSLTNDDLINLVYELKIGLILVVGYGKILKQALLDTVCGQVLNIHPSMLPMYRGVAPVVGAILDGATETGVSLIQIDQEIDHGPILAQISYPLTGKEEPAELYQILTQKGVQLFLDNVQKYLNEELELIPQDHELATFTKKIKKEDGLLNLKDNQDKLERQIRAYKGWPGTWIMDGEKQLLIKKAHKGPEHLLFDLVQPESGKEMTFEAYAAGKRISPTKLYSLWF